MITIYKRIFYDICDKNIDVYMDFITDIRNECIETIRELQRPEITVNQIRYLVHKLVGVLSFLESNNDLFYFCKMLLHIDKNNEDLSLYTHWINEIKNYNINTILPVVKYNKN